MNDKASLKARVCEEIDRHRDEICAIGEEIWRHPELGFKEFETAALVARWFERLEIPCRTGLAITGVKAIMNGREEGPTVAVMGELDALDVADHPEYNPNTGAVHACGHNAQIASLLGVAIGLAASGIMDALSGRVALMAVPAEEYIEIEYRDQLRRAGKLEFLGGKPELIRLGEFDDVNLAMMTHTSSSPEDRLTGIAASSNGCIAKQVQFLGKAAHAGGAPHKGVNALNAAMVAMAAINAHREAFKDEDSIRVHPILTKGGDAVNVVPADVRLETFVRGKTIGAIEAANIKVDYALRGGALAMGAKVRITTLPGYLPQVNDPSLASLYKANAIALYGADQYTETGHRGGSTDMGDVEHIMPAIHPYHAGGKGTSHGRDYQIGDPDAAYLGPARLMAMTVVDLLCDGASAARDILEKTKPRMTKSEYLAFMRRLCHEEEFGELA